MSKTLDEEHRALCLPWHDDDDGMLVGQHMEVIAGLAEDENGKMTPAIYRKDVRAFILKACNEYHSVHHKVDQVLARVDGVARELELRRRYSGFLLCCIKSGEHTEMSFEEFARRLTGRHARPISEPDLSVEAPPNVPLTEALDYSKPSCRWCDIPATRSLTSGEPGVSPSLVCEYHYTSPPSEKEEEL